MWHPEDIVTLLYIDNSNIFISAQKYSATKKNFLHGVQDTRCRIDMRKMIAMALQGRTLDSHIGDGWSYVSEPPPFPQEMQKAIKESGVGIRIFERNSVSKEKEVDTTLTADAVERIVLDRDKKDKLIILFTGDRDMKPVVEKAEKYQWTVHLWSFNEHLAREYERMDCLTIFRMKSYFDQVTFIETRWKKKIPEERSLTLTFSGDPPGIFLTEEYETLAEEIVEKCTELLRVPCQGKFIDLHNFALVICLQENYTNGDQIKNFYDFNVLIGSSDDYKKPEMFTNLRTACTKILANKNPEFKCTQVQTFTMFRQNKSLHSNSSLQLHNKYAPLLPTSPKNSPAPETQNGRHLNGTVNGCGRKTANGNTNGTSIRVPPPEVIDLPKELGSAKLWALLFKVWALISLAFQKVSGRQCKTLPTVKMVVPSSEPVEDEPEEKRTSKMSAKFKPSMPPPPDPYEVVRGKQKKSYRKYSKLCEFKFTCEKFPKCKCSHSLEEQEFFTLHKEVKVEMRRLYKTVECNRYKRTDIGKCKFFGRSFLCQFAHGTKEARCLTCHQHGLHFSGQCKK